MRELTVEPPGPLHDRRCAAWARAAARGPGLLALACVALAGGVALRLSGLDQHACWHDEVYTRLFAAGSHTRVWWPQLFGGQVLEAEAVRALLRLAPDAGALDTIRGLAHDEPQHPPLYYLLAGAWMRLVGEGQATLRLLSALFGILCLPAAAWLAWELTRAWRAALVAAMLVAASPFFVLYSQEAREYALWSLLVLGSCAALLAAIRHTALASPGQARGGGEGQAVVLDQPDVGQPGLLPRSHRQGARGALLWALFALLTAALLYTTLSSAVVILAQILFVAARERGRLTPVGRSAALAMAAAALACAPWFVVLLGNRQAVAASMAWSATISVPRAELLATLGLNASRWLLDLGEPGPWSAVPPALRWSGVLAALALQVVALSRLLRRGPRDARLLLGVLVVLPIALLLGPDLLLGGIRSLSARYLTPAWLALAIGLAWWLAGACERPRRSDQPARPARGSALARAPGGEGDGSLLAPRPGPPAGRRWAAAAVLLPATVLVGLASAAANASRPAVWSKGVSVGLPIVAAVVNAHPRPLLIGDRERHHPGNLLALSLLLRPEVGMQFVYDEHGYRLPPVQGLTAAQGRGPARAGDGEAAGRAAWSGEPFSEVFLFSPTLQLRRAVEAQAGEAARLVYADLHLELWRIAAPQATAGQQ